MQLITYVDRLGGDIAGLHDLLDNEFAGLFSGVHVLPFFDPIDGADAGFDPVDHARVDPRLGNWGDVRRLSTDYSVMADLIVNHVSADSPQFLDVRSRGSESPYWSLFLKTSDVFATPATPLETAAIYRPRPGAPFTSLPLDDGTAVEFWTTFSKAQLDINVESRAGQAYLDSILQAFSKAGIREIRLDAAGYAIKRRGTSCFMLPETFDFIGALSERATKLGMQTLVEIHGHYRTQIEIADRIGRVYDFALPPLVLHTLYTGESDALCRWLRQAPHNAVTVLDTHDGIGIVDVSRQGDKAGLLDDHEVSSLVDTIHEKTDGDSRASSGYSASNLDIYQINSTYYDALGGDDTAYLLARAIQFFAPGTPQVYYTGLLAGENDMPLMRRTGVGRDVNRHYYTRDEIASELQRPVVTSLLELIRQRRRSGAFDGQFSLHDSDSWHLHIVWEKGDDLAELNVDLPNSTAMLTFRSADDSRTYQIREGRLLHQASGARKIQSN